MIKGRKEKQGKIREEYSTTSTLHVEIYQEENNMVKEKPPQPRRTLGDYAM